MLNPQIKARSVLARPGGDCAGTVRILLSETTLNSVIAQYVYVLISIEYVLFQTKREVEQARSTYGLVLLLPAGHPAPKCAPCCFSPAARSWRIIS